eukprot:8165928-Pyramimonas_sp.AAC.1
MGGHRGNVPGGRGGRPRGRFRVLALKSREPQYHMCGSGTSHACAHSAQQGPPRGGLEGGA